MALVREEKLGGKAVRFPELTVKEIRDWLASKTETDDLVNALLFDEFSLSDLTVLTSLTADDIDEMVPSDLEKAGEISKEVNSRFFVMREKLAKIGRQILANPEPES